MNRIIPRLWIGDASDARQLSPDHSFDTVVTLGYFDDLGYTQPTASTTGDKFVFPDGDHDYVDFQRAVEFVVDAYNDGDNVFVHCQAGVSRSAGVCACALADINTINLSHALDTVYDSRPIVNPAPEIQNSMERYAGDSLTYNPCRSHQYDS